MNADDNDFFNPSITVILPTYNERFNIGAAIEKINNVFEKTAFTDVEILVVDDNSPDGTQTVVESIQKKDCYCKLNLIVRMEDHGLSKSINEGFKKASGDIIFVTDADLQHDVEMIPLVINYFAMYDVVVGSRYLEGGGIEEWGLVRRIISKGATYLAKCLFPTLTDPVSGFFGVNRSVVEGVDFTKSRGYKILMDVIEYGKYDGDVYEFPYMFKARKFGESKLKKMTMIDFKLQLFELIKHAVFNRNESHIWKAWEKLIKFGIVGLSGVLVNLGGYYLFTRALSCNMFSSSMVAIELSIISNFIFNNYWTFKDKSERSFTYRFASFQGISLIGLVIQMVSLALLVNYIGMYDLIAYPIAILVAFIFNYVLNTRITWKGA